MIARPDPLAGRKVVATYYPPDPQARFPESELLELIAYHEAAAKSWQGAERATIHHRFVAICRQAIDAQDALRERCLVAESVSAGALEERGAET